MDSYLVYTYALLVTPYLDPIVGTRSSYFLPLICIMCMLFHRLHVVFGHVIDGTQYVTEMENQKVDANHRPYADVRISNCGELVLMRSTYSRLDNL